MVIDGTLTKVSLFHLLLGCETGDNAKVITDTIYTGYIIWRKYGALKKVKGFALFFVAASLYMFDGSSHSP